MKNDLKKWWDKYAEYYQSVSNIPTKTAHYGPFSPNEDELELLGDVSGKKILELGCGAGQCSIAFSKQGAICTAIDFSESQLKIAEALAEREMQKISFIKADIAKIKFNKNEKFDIAFSVFAMQFVENLGECFRNINILLKAGGRLVFSLDHPFYSIVSNDCMLEGSYYDVGRSGIIETNDVFGGKTSHDASEEKFYFYKRKISDMFNELINAGFEVKKIVEPNTFSDKDPWSSMYSPKVVALIGPTIIFVAEKKLMHKINL